MGEINEDSIRIETFLDDLESIRQVFGYQKITVLGHSWGGFLAMQYAMTHPTSIDKLILLSTMPASSEEFSLFAQEWKRRMAPYQEDLKRVKERPEFALGDPATIEEYYQIMFRTYFYDPQKANLLNLRMSPQAALNGFKVYDLFRQSLFDKPYNIYDQLAHLDIPTLIVHGDSDPISSDVAQKLHQSVFGFTYSRLNLKICISTAPKPWD